MLVKRIYDGNGKLYATLNVDGPRLNIITHTSKGDNLLALDKRSIDSLIESLKEIRDSSDEDDIVYRLRKKSDDRKLVQEGKLDRITLLLDEAADEIERLRDL